MATFRNPHPFALDIVGDHVQTVEPGEVIEADRNPAPGLFVDTTEPVEGE
jgi:hypothetical protein